MAGLTMDVGGLEDVQFGEEIRRKEFCLRPNTTFLNNGSYGAVPKRVLEMQKRYLDLTESDPDDWFFNRMRGLYEEARQAVAHFVGAEEEDVVFVVNATMGVNTVLRSLQLRPGDAILATSLTYGSLQLLWEDVADDRIYPEGVEALLMDVKLPIVSEDALVQQYHDYLSDHPHVKLVLIDHITSPSGVLMPVQRVAEVCRRHGVMVMVDGAHAPGQLPLSLPALGVDFYTGNLHKWAYSPRGCAFLWIRRQHHGVVMPPQTSWERGQPLADQFRHQGTRDYSAFVCATHALQFLQAIGGVDKVVTYTRDLATRGRDLLEKEVGLERLDIPPSMEAPNMRLLKLPGRPPDCPALDITPGGMGKLKRRVFQEDDMQAYFNWVDGALYLRISAQVYNSMEDFRKLVPILKRVRDSCVPLTH